MRWFPGRGGSNLDDAGTVSSCGGATNLPRHQHKLSGGLEPIQSDFRCSAAFVLERSNDRARAVGAKHRFGDLSLVGGLIVE